MNISGKAHLSFRLLLLHPFYRINRGRSVQASSQEVSASTLCAETSRENFMFLWGLLLGFPFVSLKRIQDGECSKLGFFCGILQKSYCCSDPSPTEIEITHHLLPQKGSSQGECFGKIPSPISQLLKGYENLVLCCRP